MLQTKLFKKAACFLSLLAAANATRSLHAQTPAFPGAEGFGRYATGGRNGSVYIVTNLNNAGPGSLRDAVSQPNRIVVFAVGGVIRIATRIVVSANITIAGQTAPGGGITVYGNGISYSGANNSICRYLRVRMGKNGDSGKDALALANGSNMIFDHVSVSWGRDENFSISGENPANITIQNSIIGQGLWSHSCGGLIQTDSGVSLFRNLYIDNQTRNPKVKGKNEFVNNIVYNWGGGGGYILGDSGGESFANIFNNYFIKGPYTTIAPFTRGNLNFKAYCAENYYDATLDGVLNGNVLVQQDYGTGEDSIDWQPAAFAYPIQPSSPSVVPVAGLLSSLVNNVGGAYPRRDAVDSIMIAELSSLGITGNAINTFTDETMQLPDATGTVYNAPAPPDADQDGMPDAWELAHSLNPASAADAMVITASGYTNLELYINDIINTPPAAFVPHPTQVVAAAASFEQVNLTWQDNTGDETAFLLERSLNDSSYTLLATLAPNTTAYADTGLAFNTQYYYRIRAATTADTSAYAPVAHTATPPVPGYPLAPVSPVPEHLSQYVSPGTISLKWNGSDSTQLYHVWFGTSPGTLTNIKDTTGEGLALAPLQYATTYYWRIDATGSIGTTTGNLWSFTTATYTPPGLTGYWKLDETTGTTVTDYSGYGNDGEIANNDHYVRGAGYINNGLNFNPDVAETQSAIVIPNDDVLMNNDHSFTISMWIKGPPTTPNCYLIHKGSFALSTTAGTTGKWWGIERNGSNFRFAVDNNVVKTQLTANNGSTAFFNNTWVHVIAVRSMSDHRLRLFVNGVLNKAMDDATVGDIGEPGPLLLGNSNDLNVPYKAQIDEVRLYNYAFTDADALNLYNAQVVLPVQFIDVTAARQQDLVALHWEIGLEIGTKEYIVERSEDNIHFTDVGTVAATQKSLYSFDDKQAPAVKLFYRIRAVDADGRTTYSRMAQVEAGIPGAMVRIAPNPVIDKTFGIETEGAYKGTLGVRLYDAEGRLALQKTFVKEDTRFSGQIVLPASLAAGVYQLVVQQGTDHNVLKLLIH